MELPIQTVIVLILVIAAVLISIQFFGKVDVFSVLNLQATNEVFQPNTIYVAGGGGQSLPPKTLTISSPSCESSGTLGSSFDVQFVKKLSLEAKSYPNTPKIEFYMVLSYNGKLIPGKNSDGKLTLFTCSPTNNKMECSNNAMIQMKFAINNMVPTEQNYFHFTLWKKSASIEDFLT
ncbi:MAG: hypothetical protein HY832_00060, partial [Candidatus Aenigmarchaeota archaeon]|nr:hypothetical protein [Candidatus Aenigmarchaeota archaeon]